MTAEDELVIYENAERLENALENLTSIERSIMAMKVEMKAELELLRTQIQSIESGCRRSVCRPH